MPFVCAAPFTDLLVNSEFATSCCPVWVAERCRAPLAGPWATWNSPEFRALRGEMLAGDASSCLNCPRRGEPALTAESPEYLPVMESGPRLLMLGDDNTCNLRCPSCRGGPIAVAFDPHRYGRLVELVTAFAPSIRLLSLAHTGDPFASPLYRRFLTEFDPGLFPAMRLRLLTNGLMMPDLWDGMTAWHDRLQIVDQSIDGATAATYERIRLGGTWPALLRSLSYISALKPPEWAVKFIVQRDNYRELPNLVEMLEPYGVTAVYPMALDCWHQDPAEFAAKNVCDPAHPEHADWLANLAASRSPILRDEVIRTQMAMLTAAEGEGRS
jgi:hypothetical protein